MINSIRKSYDVVFVVFWQGMLSFQTIEAIYDKFDSQFYFGVWIILLCLVVVTLLVTVRNM